MLQMMSHMPLLWCCLKISWWKGTYTFSSAQVFLSPLPENSEQLLCECRGTVELTSWSFYMYAVIPFPLLTLPVVWHRPILKHHFEVWYVSISGLSVASFPGRHPLHFLTAYVTFQPGEGLVQLLHHQMTRWTRSWCDVDLVSVIMATCPRSRIAIDSMWH